jgi:hypothetical protein
MFRAPITASCASRSGDPRGAYAARRKGTTPRIGMSKGVRDTTMIYTHVLNRGPSGVTSPAERVLDL